MFIAYSSSSLFLGRSTPRRWPSGRTPPLRHVEHTNSQLHLRPPKFIIKGDFPRHTNKMVEAWQATPDQPRQPLKVSLEKALLVFYHCSPSAQNRLYMTQQLHAVCRWSLRQTGTAALTPPNLQILPAQRHCKQLDHDLKAQLVKLACNLFCYYCLSLIGAVFAQYGRCQAPSCGN